MRKSKLDHTAQHALGTARNKLDEAASSKRVRDMRDRLRSNIKDLPAYLPGVEFRPPERKLKSR